MTPEQMQADFEKMVSDPFFGEQVIYTASGQQPKLINAIVYRDELFKANSRSDKGNTSYQFSHTVAVRVNRKDVPVVTEKEDLFEFPLNIGEANSKFRASRIIGQDPGTYKIGLSK